MHPTKRSRNVPLRYAETAHQRRHGPQGYLDYRHYKPWLRDEFQFRCVYCLCRERWFPDGDDSFSIDHLRPQSAAPESGGEYGNLVYACWRCNSAKQDTPPPLDPDRDTFANHVELCKDGTVRGLTPQGEALIRACRLNRPKLAEFRRGLFALHDLLKNHRDAAAIELLRKYFGYPDNLPRLASLRPPGGNLRPEGIHQSYYELRQRGELPGFY